MAQKLPLPRWLIITLVAIVVGLLVFGLVKLTQYNAVLGWSISGVLILAVVLIAVFAGPPLIRLYKFQRYFKKYEGQLSMLPALMQAGRVQEALVRFEGVMKHAPENAFLYYLRAFFLKTAGKLPEAMSAANKALSMVDRDPFLQLILKEMGGQMGQPTTVAGFREQLEDLRDSLEPRVADMRMKRERARATRKKKSR